MSARNLKLVNEVKDLNLLKGVALQVYEIVCRKPGLTVGEMAIEYAGTGDDPTSLGRSRNELAKRVSDLVNFGAIRPDGKTLCPYTNRQVNRYVPTGSLPERDNLFRARTPETTLPPTVVRVEKALSFSTHSVLSSLRSRAYSVQFLWWVPKSIKIQASLVVKALDEVLFNS